MEPPPEPAPVGWEAGAAVGGFVAVVIAGLLYALAGGTDARRGPGDDARRAAGAGHCLAFLALPPAQRDFIEERVLYYGEHVLWAGRTSTKAVAWTAVLVLLVGGGLTGGWWLYCTWHGEWDGLAAVVALGLAGITAFFGVLVVQGRARVLYLLTPQRAVAVYPVPRGYTAFSYGTAHLGRTKVVRHWLVPGVGSVVFPTARAQAARTQESDPGPCGFLGVDRPRELAGFIRATFPSGDDEPVDLKPARPVEPWAQQPRKSAATRNGTDSRMSLFLSRK